MESHLLQMRGLKHKDDDVVFVKLESHLLQMRGLKLDEQDAYVSNTRRIFYRCVD